MVDLLSDIRHELQRHKNLADKAIAQMGDHEYFLLPAPQVNSVAIIVKHIAGNLHSRFIDFLTTDGEKPSRDRDGEFKLTAADTREHLHQTWERGWQTLFNALQSLSPSNLGATVSIRGEPHTVCQALLRSMTHLAYHTGQILYLARLLHPESPWLTVEPGKSRGHAGTYLADNRGA